MTVNDILLDAFERVKGSVHRAVEGLGEEKLAERPGEEANSIAWLVWHLTRIQDDHVAELAVAEQVWLSGWAEKFGLPFDDQATGYGQTSDEVGMVQASADDLLAYYDAVHNATVNFVQRLKPAELDKIVDTGWDPPVTMGVRLVSVIADDLQHAGQAAYVRGLITQ